MQFWGIDSELAAVSMTSDVSTLDAGSGAVQVGRCWHPPRKSESIIRRPAEDAIPRFSPSGPRNQSPQNAHNESFFGIDQGCSNRFGVGHLGCLPS